MKKILIQAGHGGRTSGATGAPGEQKWTTEIVPKIASKLREYGFEVRTIGADPTSSEIAGDWDLFLAVHYDADVYKDRGGFVDYPEPSTDGATKESQRITGEIRKTYFSTTGIPEHNERSNRNTRYYYMWSKMSLKTPCVLIEAGVGYRTPEDHQTLWFEQDKVIKGITDGIRNALQPEPPKPPVDECKTYKDKIVVLQEQLDVTVEENGKLSDRVKELENTIRELNQEIEDHVCPTVPDDTEWVANGKSVTYKDYENGTRDTTITTNYERKT